MTAVICSTVRRILGNSSGATAIEYALLGSLIAVVIIGAVASIGLTLGDIFTGANSDLTAASQAGLAAP